MVIPSTVSARALTWRDLVALEPKLNDLLDEALAWRTRERDEEFCANAVFCGYDGHRGIKTRMEQLVGWYREGAPEILQTCEAYVAAHRTLYEALPFCGPHCSCL